VRTVLGLSKTSTSIGWVLVDGRDAAADPLDHDAFDVTSASAADSAATARRARGIAATTGYHVDCVRVTTSDVVPADITSLRKALAESGFDEVVTVPLPEAAKAWAKDVAVSNGHKKTAICIFGRDTVALSVIHTGSGAVKTRTTVSRDPAGLIDWLTTALGRNGSRPESLYLLGSRSELDEIADQLDAALSIPVIATYDAQLALARGAAVSTAKYFGEPVGHNRSGLASAAKISSVVAAVAVASLFALSGASAPIHMAENNIPYAESPPTPRAAEIPASAAPVSRPVASPVLPPQPSPEQAAPVSAPEPEPEVQPELRPAPAATFAAVPKTITEPAPETAAIAAPEQHLPGLQPLLRVPEAQPAVAPAPAAAPAPVAAAPAAAPAPVAPPPASVPSPSPTTPPPPPDPLQQILSPFFSALP
jgi:hypothetical protein